MSQQLLPELYTTERLSTVSPVWGTSAAHSLHVTPLCGLLRVAEVSSNCPQQCPVAAQSVLHSDLDTDPPDMQHPQPAPVTYFIFKTTEQNTIKMQHSTVNHHLTCSCASRATKSFSKPSCLRIRANTEFRSRPRSSGRAASFSWMRDSASATSRLKRWISPAAWSRCARLSMSQSSCCQHSLYTTCIRNVFDTMHM